MGHRLGEDKTPRLAAPPGLHPGQGGGASPNANKRAVNGRKRKWVLAGPRTSNVHQRHSLPCSCRSKCSGGSGVKVSGSILEAEHKSG